MFVNIGEYRRNGLHYVVLQCKLWVNIIYCEYFATNQPHDVLQMIYTHYCLHSGSSIGADASLPNTHKGLLNWVYLNLTANINYYTYMLMATASWRRARFHSRLRLTSSEHKAGLWAMPSENKVRFQTVSWRHKDAVCSLCWYANWRQCDVVN